jgi:hypothetical protein
MNFFTMGAASLMTPPSVATLTVNALQEIQWRVGLQSFASSIRHRTQHQGACSVIPPFR